MCCATSCKVERLHEQVLGTVSNLSFRMIEGWRST